MPIELKHARIITQDSPEITFESHYCGPAVCQALQAYFDGHEWMMACCVGCGENMLLEERIVADVIYNGLIDSRFDVQHSHRDELGRDHWNTYCSRCVARRSDETTREA